MKIHYFRFQYVHGLVSDFDLLIVGGYYDARRKNIYKFLAAVFKKDEDKFDSGVLYGCCNVVHGLNQEQYDYLRTRLGPHWNPVRKTKEGRSTISHSPKGIEWKNASPDVWIEPRLSVIVQVYATELIETEDFPVSHMLRFPRVQSIREDKMWYDCCTLAEYNNLCLVCNYLFKLSNGLVEKIKYYPF